MPDPQYDIPNDPDVTPEDIEPGADLSEADLTSANLRGADLIDADLVGADLTDADLFGADLSEANLRRADLSEANLRRADLSDVDLYQAVLTGADLFGADLNDANLGGADLTGATLSEAVLTGADLLGAALTGADLRGADLTDAYLRGADLTDAYLQRANLIDAYLAEVNLSGITLSRSTQIDAPDERITNELTSEDLVSVEQQYDTIARTNHELRTAYSANGLTGRARSARVRERKARRREAFAEGGRLSRGTAAWFGSHVSRFFTGYGVQLRWVAGVMILLYLLSAGVYHFIGEMSVGQSLYYSVVTFTTSPPEPAPTGLVMRAVAGFETFAGTTAVVFLGYVLGTREQV